MVCFPLLWQNTWAQVIYKEQKFRGSGGWEIQERETSTAPHLVRAFLLYHDMVGGIT